MRRLFASILLVLFLVSQAWAAPIALPPASQWTLGTGLETIGGSIIRLENQYDKMILAEPSLIHYWPLDGDYFDKKGVYNGTNTSKVFFGSGDSKYSYRGVFLASDYLNLGNIPSNWSTVTLCGWFSNNQTAERQILTKDNNSSARAFDLLSYLANAHFFTLFFGSTSGYITADTPLAYNDGLPHFYGVIFNAGNAVNDFKIVIDGVDTGATVSNTGFTGSTVANPTTNATIGARGAGLTPWLGTLGGIAIYNSMLSVAQLAAHYNTSMYNSNSPEADTGWIAIDYNTLDATTPFVLSENLIGPIMSRGTGSVKYQYALNNGAFNGSWVTQAQVNSGIANTTITDHTYSARFKAQFISDGSIENAVDISWGFVNASGLTEGSGGGQWVW